jgi:hypothetical protein
MPGLCTFETGGSLIRLLRGYMDKLYILIATVFVILEGFFPWHWHGFVNKAIGKEQTYKEVVSQLTPLFIFREYFLNTSLAIVGWVSGYYLIFHRDIFRGDPALFIAASIVFLLGSTGYLPNFIVNRLGSLK